MSFLTTVLPILELLTNSNLAGLSLNIVNIKVYSIGKLSDLFCIVYFRLEFML